MPNTRPTMLRLSAAAIERLLGDDPVFKLDLQRAVVAEVVRRLMPHDLNDVVYGAIRTSTSQARDAITAAGIDAKAISVYAEKEVSEAVRTVAGRTYLNSPSKARMAELSSMVDKAIVTGVAKALDEKTGVIQEALETRAKRMLASVEGQIAEAVEVRFHQQVDKIINDRVAERLAAIKAAL